MSIQQLCVLLNDIENTPGKIDKFALLTNVDPKLVPMLKEYLSISMDWYRIYGVGQKTIEPDPEIDRLAVARYPATWDGFAEMVKWLEDNHSRGFGLEALSKANLRAVISSFPADQQKWLQRAILKTVTIGVSEKTVNKVWPKLINIFEVQLADSCEKAEDAKFPCVLEPKLDGIRAVCRVNPKNKTVKFLSRGGQPLYNTFTAGIDALLLNIVKEETIFDGELYTGNFNESQSITSDENPGDDKIDAIKKLRYYVFDMLTAKEWDDQKCDRTFTERRKQIPFCSMNEEVKVLPKVVKTATHDVDCLEDLKALNSSYLLQGLEGVMLKDPQGKYIFKRSKAWLKHKPFETDDYEVVGITEGNKKKTKGKVASLVIKLGEGLTCEVGSGLTDEQREAFMAKPPIGEVVEVKYKMKTPDGLLREPTLVRMRPDKKAG